MKRWSSEDIKYLKNRHKTQTAQSIAEVLGRSANSVRTKAYELGLEKQPPTWSKEEIEYLKVIYLEMGAERAAKELGRTLSAIHTKIREIGGGRASIGPRVDWSEEELDYLRQNYQTSSLEELTAHLGRTKNAVNRRATMLGLQKYIEPYPFFENFTEESAYVLGFFAAEGYVSKRGPESIRISFSQSETDILYLFQRIIGSGRITTKQVGCSEFYIQSVKVYDFLCKLFGQDMGQKKSRTINWPSVPDEYMKHFIRGATDGDGSLIKRKDGLWEISYCSASPAFIKGYEETVLRLTGIRGFTHLNKIDVYHTRFVGLKAVCLASWLYKDAKIALERKEWIAREMYNTLGGTAYADSLTPKMREMFPEIIGTYNIVG